MIQTKNLILLPTELRHFQAMSDDDKTLGSLIDATVPPSYPVERDALPWFCSLLENDPSLVGWLHFMIVLSEKRTLIGDVGFKGKPGPDGLIEIGYSIVPEFRGHGYATEACKALVGYAFSKAEVNRIRAHTRKNNPGSIKVVEKMGFHVIDSVDDPEEGPMWRWILEKS